MNVKPSWAFDSDFAPIQERLQPLIGKESDGAILGVGVAFMECSVPLVLANVRFAPFFDSERTPILPISEAGVIAELLAPFDPPRRSLVMFVEPPMPLGAGREGVYEGMVPIRGEMRGTLGPCLPPEFCPVSSSTGGDVFLTAGHVVGPPYSLVQEIVERPLLPSKKRHLGAVTFRCSPEPYGPPEYDVALIGTSATNGSRCRVASLEPFQSRPIPTSIRGGTSGLGHGQVIGALGPYCDAEGRLNWKNSWIMQPGTLGTAGDSGAPVETTAGETLGILVGGSGVIGQGFAALYIQDLEAVIVDLFL